jgi:Tfp pilus assembly protein PilN
VKILNFLPEDFFERRSRCRATLICAIIGGGSLLTTGAAVALTFVAMLGMAQIRAVVEQQYQEATAQIDQLKQLEDRKAGLLRKVDLSTALLERVPRSYLLARLVNYLPPQTSLMMVLMKMEEVEVKAPEQAAGAGSNTGAAAKGSAGGAGATAGADDPAKPAPGAGKRGKSNTIKVKQFVFRVDGLAPTDVRVAEYLTRLTSDPMFREVDLQFSEEFPQREGVTMRRFQLSFRLSSDAEKILDSAATATAALTAASPAPPLAKGEP